MGLQLGHGTWRLHSVSLADVTGLTFLTFGRQVGFRLGGVHAHTPKEPSAEKTVERMKRWLRTPDIARYCPLSPDDCVHVLELPGLPYPDVPGSETWIVPNKELFESDRYESCFWARNDGEPWTPTTHPGERRSPLPTRLVWGYRFPEYDHIGVLGTLSALPGGQGPAVPSHDYISDAIAIWSYARHTAQTYAIQDHQQILNDTFWRFARKGARDGRLPPEPDIRMKVVTAGVTRVEAFVSVDGESIDGFLFSYKSGRQIANGSCFVNSTRKTVVYESPKMACLLWVVASSDVPARY